MNPKEPIILSLLTDNLADFTKRLEFARTTTKAVHLDVIDGTFCDGQSVPIEDWPELNIGYTEAHLMVKNPIKYLPKLAAKKINRAYIHIESDVDLNELSNQAREVDLLLGWAISPDTDLEKIRPFYDVSTNVLVMGVHPGSNGQTMIPTTPSSVAFLKRVPGRRVTVTIDGGVALETLDALRQAGANYFVSSQAVFGTTEWQENLAQLQSALKELVR